MQRDVHTYIARVRWSLNNSCIYDNMQVGGLATSLLHARHSLSGSLLSQASRLSHVSNLGTCPDRTVFYINTGQSIPCGKKAAVRSAGLSCIMYWAAACAESFHISSAYLVHDLPCVDLLRNTFTWAEREEVYLQDRLLRSCPYTRRRHTASVRCKRKRLLWWSAWVLVVENAVSKRQICVHSYK